MTMMLRIWIPSLVSYVFQFDNSAGDRRIRELRTRRVGRGHQVEIEGEPDALLAVAEECEDVAYRGHLDGCCEYDGGGGAARRACLVAAKRIRAATSTVGAP